jgi:hypothetical protein
MNRFAFSIYCDDVRQEVGNKLSLIGIYREKMLVSALPVLIPKLCVCVWARTPESKPFRALKIKLFLNDKILVEQDAPSLQMDEAQSARTALTPLPGESLMPTLTAQIAVQISPLPIEAPSVLRVRVQTEEEELRAGGLTIEVAGMHAG